MSMLSPKDIKKLLIDKEISGRQIGMRLGLSNSTVSQTINHRIKSERVRKGIAECLAMPYDLLWGNDPASNCTDDSLAESVGRVND